MKKHSFYLNGTRCQSCKILIEDQLQQLDFISFSSVDLTNKQLTIICKEKQQNKNALMEKINKIIQKNGYQISSLPFQNKPEKAFLWQALPIGLAILLIFFLMQKSGIINFNISGQNNALMGFIIGLIASVSSCLAVVGGVVLSLSANLAQSKLQTGKIISIFHLSRIISFTILGGILGVIGNAIAISLNLTSILGLVTSIIILLLGFNLIGLLRKFKIVLPFRLFSIKNNNKNTVSAPLLLGITTFFLPCGFTQSMQIAALSSGSFINGAVLMLAFSLGTFPMLAILSFGSASFSKSKYADLFFQTSGIVVIGLAIYGLLTSLAALGIINPIIIN